MKINRNDNQTLLEGLVARSDLFPALDEIVILRGESADFTSYSGFLELGEDTEVDEVYEFSKNINPHDICNLQFTSGTTGNPKAASLTHQYVCSSADKFGAPLD